MQYEANDRRLPIAVGEAQIERVTCCWLYILYCKKHFIINTRRHDLTILDSSRRSRLLMHNLKRNQVSTASVNGKQQTNHNMCTQHSQYSSGHKCMKYADWVLKCCRTASAHKLYEVMDKCPSFQIAWSFFFRPAYKHCLRADCLLHWPLLLVSPVSAQTRSPIYPLVKRMHNKRS